MDYDETASQYLKMLEERARYQDAKTTMTPEEFEEWKKAQMAGQHSGEAAD
jgi:hypothetical protein